MYVPPLVPHPALSPPLHTKSYKPKLCNEDLRRPFSCFWFRRNCPRGERNGGLAGAAVTDYLTNRIADRKPSDSGLLEIIQCAADRLTVVWNGYCERALLTSPVFVHWAESSHTYGPNSFTSRFRPSPEFRTQFRGRSASFARERTVAFGAGSPPSLRKALDGSRKSPRTSKDLTKENYSILGGLW